jgi:uroporphyrinogen-III decarboxylase
MTGRERILRTFRRERTDRIAWQPRIYYWYNGKTAMGDMPEEYRGKTMLEVYDDLGALPRYAPEVLGFSFLGTSTDHTVQSRVFDKGAERTIVRQTPVGEIRETVRKGGSGSGSYHTEYPVKSPADMRVIAYILDHTRFSFNEESFRRAEEAFGERAMAQAFFARSPYQRLVISYMGMSNTVYALADYPDETEALMNKIDEWDDHMYDILADSPMQVFNFGENIDANNSPPDIFKRYLIPYYRKRVQQLRRAGKFSHIHMDGALKPLLPMITEPGFDGIEAATPLPQGDVTLEELKDAFGDTILLDGIPAILFLPQYSIKDVATFATNVLEMFSPNLILGVSDELPPVGDIEKVRLVSQLVEQYEV